MLERDGILELVLAGMELTLLLSQGLREELELGYGALLLVAVTKMILMKDFVSCILVVGVVMSE